MPKNQISEFLMNFDELVAWRAAFADSVFEALTDWSATMPSVSGTDDIGTRLVLVSFPLEETVS